MAAKLRPRVMLPRSESTSAARAAEARGRQLQRLVGRRASGYILARMRFEIVLAPGAARALKALRADWRSEVRDAIETHLRHEPRKASKSRIKRLRGMSKPQFRLRVGEIRVFYDVTNEAVEVLAIVTKAEAQGWLEE